MRQLTASTSAMAIGLTTCFGGAGLAEAATMDELERRIERLESLLRERDIDLPKEGPNRNRNRGQASAAPVQVGPQRATFGNDLPVQERLDELTPPPAAKSFVAKTAARQNRPGRPSRTRVLPSATTRGCGLAAM